MLLTEPLDYTFQIQGFEGPLDLLLRLIEREEFDITTIALAHVADAYLAHVRSMEAPNPAQLSAFLVIAARLLLIKSRALLPRPPAPPPDGQPDEAEQLVAQLREYQRYKQAAALLRAWEDQGRRTYARIAPPPAPIAASDQIDVTIGQLIAAVQRRMQLALPIEPQAVPMPAPKLLTVAQVAVGLSERLRRQAWISFEDLLPLVVRRVEVVVTLWAVLELLKRHAIVVEQEALFGPIRIGRGPALAEVDMRALDEDTPSEG